MLYLALVIFVASIGILLARAVRTSGVRQRSLVAAGLRVGGLIALIRLGLLWGGLALYTGHGDWRQVAGYALLILNSVVELALAAHWSGSQPGPPLLLAGLIALTSAVLGFAWAWARLRGSFRGAA